MRVVSLLPSTTEIVCALGAEDLLVGRSHECDYPPSVRNLPVCTASRIDGNASSAGIDGQVRESLRNGLSLYEVLSDVIERLRPDVILTQDLCKVCAVSPDDVRAALACLGDVRPTLVTTAPTRVADLWDDIRRVGTAIGKGDAAEELVGELGRQIATTSARANGWGRRPTVACLEWLDPLMASGNWVPELVELAGGVNLFGKAGEHSPAISFDDLYREDPDVIVAVPCGFGLGRAKSEMGTLTGNPHWPRLRAVRNGRVHIADGNAFFNRPGPRLVEAVEMLAEAIQPAAFCFGHEGMEVFSG